VEVCSLSSNAKKALAIGGGVLVLALGAYLLLGGRDDNPLLDAITPSPDTCPLTGEEPRDDSALDRAAVAVKIENAAVAYPLSGLEDADIVFEEVVEGGATRFLAIYHCSDSSKAGPVRSARAVDPAIMIPVTRLLAFSGANAPVMKVLEEHDVVILDESSANGGLQRVPRDGVSSEHTLYANSRKLRRVGEKEFDDAPDDIFDFGDREGRSRKARTITISFSGATTVGYEWSGDEWLRTQNGEPLVAETGDQIAVDNVLVEAHEVNLSDTIVDVAGNPSTEIADETGSGRAVLFRDGRAIAGTWTRESVEEAVAFETRAGDEMVFAPGSIWIHLVPNGASEVEGSFEYART
jgi:hypothetical protein